MLSQFQDPAAAYAFSQTDRIVEPVFGFLGVNDAIFCREDRAGYVPLFIVRGKAG